MAERRNADYHSVIVRHIRPRRMNPKNVKIALVTGLVTGFSAMIDDKCLEEADDCHYSVFGKGREARPAGVTLCRSREPAVEADSVSGHRHEGAAGRSGDRALDRVVPLAARKRAGLARACRNRADFCAR